MDETNIDFTLATSELLIQWLAQIPFLEKETKRLLFEIGSSTGFRIHSLCKS